MFNKKFRQKKTRNIRNREDNSEEEDEPILTPNRSVKDGKLEGQQTELDVVYILNRLWK